MTVSTILVLVLLAPLAHAAEPTIGSEPIHGEGPVGLIRAVLSADAIVEAKTLPDGAYQVIRAYKGPLGPGSRLPYSQCARIEPRYDPEETLQRLSKLPVGSRSPTSSARFLLLVALNKDKTWAFRQRAAGDLYLLERGKVYQLTEDQDDPKKPQLWTPFSWLPEEQPFLRELDRQMHRRGDLEAAARESDTAAKVERLKGFLDPQIQRDPMVLEAIQMLAEAGPKGLDSLSAAVDRPGMEPFVPMLMRKFAEKRYAGAVPWLSGRCRDATSHLNGNEVPFDSTNVVMEDAQAFAEIQACLRALSEIGAPSGAEAARDAGAWLLSHKAEWWATTFRSAADAEPELALMRATGSSGKALASQAAAISSTGAWPGQEAIDRWVKAFPKQYGRDAVPFLLWAWKKGSEQARTNMEKVSGQSLGADPIAWWDWYWRSVLHPKS